MLDAIKLVVGVTKDGRLHCGRGRRRQAGESKNPR